MTSQKNRGGSRGRVQEVRTPPRPPEMTYGFLIQLVFCQKKNYVVYPGAEVEQQTSAPPPKKNPGSAPEESLREVYDADAMRYLHKE